MVELDIKVNFQQRLAYIPKRVVKSFGTKLKMIPNTKAAILYSEGTDLKDVLKSVEILTADLKHRIEMENENKPKNLEVNA